MCEQTIDNKVPTNRFNDQFSSTIRPIKIFLPKKSQNDDYYVGRERLSERLFMWLSDTTKKNGSFLVTGFRGMGKSTLVNRTLDRITRKIDHKKELWAQVAIICLIIGIGVIIESQCNGCCPWHIFIGIVIIIASIICFIVSWRIPFLSKESHENSTNQKELKGKNFNETFIDRLLFFHKKDIREAKYRRISVTVNLGHEVLRERDILGLIATNVRNSYKKYYRGVL